MHSEHDPRRADAGHGSHDAPPRRDAVAELSPVQAQQRLRHGAVLIDIREEHERAGGQAEGALAIAQAQLESEPARHLPDRQVEVLLICQGGRRSLATAQRLRHHGYARVASVAGGTSAWAQAGLPLHVPEPDPHRADFLARYSRHLRLPQVGLHGQQRLADARVLLVGAGGLGSPAAFYLAAAGVGRLRLVDDDRVERSNLQRQILHADAEIGRPKVESAARRLAALNPTVQIEALRERVTPENVERLLDGVDVVIDGADNFPTRYLLNDACVKLGKPMVYGAVQQFDGQVSVFDAGLRRGQAPCYRCLFPDPPLAEAAPSCSEAGVLGVLPGVIGLLQASEALKLLLGIGRSLSGRLLCFDALAMEFRELRLRPDPDCRVCAPDARFPGYAAMPEYCSA